MSLRLVAAIQGSLREQMVQEGKAADRAVTIGTRATTERLKLRLRGQIRAVGMSARLANAVRSEVYPKGRNSIAAAGLVYGKGNAALILRAFNDGVTIRHRGGKYLAIPTGYNQRSGWRGRQPLIITPQQMAMMKGWTFTLPFEGGKIWFLRITRAQERRRGRVRNLAYAGGIKLVGSGRAKRTGAVLKFGAVPMFILLRSVTFQKRLDWQAEAERARDELPGEILNAWPDASGTYSVR